MTETAPCEKCETEISVTADKCAQCGYEPGGHGTIATIIMVLCALGVLFNAFFVLITVVTVAFTDATLVEGIRGVIPFVAAAFIPALILYYFAGKERKSPTGEIRAWSDV